MWGIPTGDAAERSVLGGAVKSGVNRLDIVVWSDVSGVRTVRGGERSVP